MQFLILLLAVVQCIQAASLKNLLLKRAFNATSSSSPSANDYLVTSLPGLNEIAADKVPKIYAGYITLDAKLDKKYFFIRYNKTQKVDNKLLFWYNGGPGCSSMDGALLESGPLYVTTDDKLAYKEGTWFESTDLVFVDQPAGTGFSESKKDDGELNQIADDMMVFYEKYFKIFPDDLEKSIYLGGESYAGEYIPYFGARILSSGSKQYKLKGLIMINGYIYPDVQNLSIWDYALEKGIIDNDTYNSGDVQETIAQCQKNIEDAKEKYATIFSIMEETGEYNVGNETDKANKVESVECNNILYDLLDMKQDDSAPSDQQCINQYDYTLRDSYPACGMNWPAEEPALKQFLNSEDVYDSLHLDDGVKWEECADAPQSALVNRHSYPAYFKMPYILERIPVMLMIGENDIVCNYVGLENMVSNMTWGGASTAGFSASTEYQGFTVAGNGTSLGKAKYERNLWIARVHNASHMIPYDHPVASRAAIDLFFGDYNSTGGGYVTQAHEAGF